MVLSEVAQKLKFFLRSGHHKYLPEYRNISTFKTKDIYRIENLLSLFIQVSKSYFLIIHHLLDSNEAEFQNILASYEQFYHRISKDLNLLDLNHSNYKKGVEYKQSVKKICIQLESVIKISRNFLSKGHKLKTLQQDDINLLLEEFSNFMNFGIHKLHTKQSSGFEDIKNKYTSVIELIEKQRKRTIKLVKKEEIPQNYGLEFHQIITGTENLTIQLYKIIREYS